MSFQQTYMSKLSNYQITSIHETVTSITYMRKLSIYHIVSRKCLFTNVFYLIQINMKKPKT